MLPSQVDEMFCAQAVRVPDPIEKSQWFHGSLMTEGLQVMALTFYDMQADMEIDTVAIRFYSQTFLREKRISPGTSPSSSSLYIAFSEFLTSYRKPKPSDFISS